MHHKQVRRNSDHGIFTLSRGSVAGEVSMAQGMRVDRGRSRDSLYTSAAQKHFSPLRSARSSEESNGSPPKRRRANSTTKDEAQQGYQSRDNQPQRAQSRDLMPPPVRPYHTIQSTQFTTTGVPDSYLLNSTPSRYANHVLELPNSVLSISPAPNAWAGRGMHGFELQGFSALHGSSVASRPLTSTYHTRLLKTSAHIMHGLDQQRSSSLNGSSMASRPMSSVTKTWLFTHPAHGDQRQGFKSSCSSLRPPHSPTPTTTTEFPNTPDQRKRSTTVLDTPDHLGALAAPYPFYERTSRNFRYHSQRSKDEISRAEDDLQRPIERLKPRAQSPRLQKSFAMQPPSRVSSRNWQSSTAFEIREAGRTDAEALHHSSTTATPVQDTQSSHFDPRRYSDRTFLRPSEIKIFSERFALPPYQSGPATRLPYCREDQSVFADGELDELRGRRMSRSSSTSRADISPIRPSRISMPPPSLIPARGRSPACRSTGILNNIRSSDNHCRTAIASRHRVPIGASTSPGRNVAASPHFAAQNSVDTQPQYVATPGPNHMSLSRYPAENPPRYLKASPRRASTRAASPNGFSFVPSVFWPASSR